MTAPRRILFVSSNFPPVVGGSGVVYDQICRNAADRVIAVGSRLNHDTGETLTGIEEFDAECPYPIFRRDYLRPRTPNRTHGRLNRFLDVLFNDAPVMLGTLMLLITLTLRFRIHVVCLGDLVYGGWLVFPLRYLLGRKVILYTHGEEISEQGDHRLGRMRMLFLRHANAIVSVSLFCKSQIVSIYNIDARRIFVIPNGVESKVFSRGEPDPTVIPEAARGHPTVLSVSRLVERKGQENLIRAFPAVLERVPDARCLIVGSGPLAGRLQSVAQELGLEDKVLFLGGVPLDTLVRLYRTCDIFALPCRHLPNGDTEGFGLVFLEANACGLPVVAGAAGGTVEAVIDGETGLLINGDDIGQIADATTRLLSDPALAKRLSEFGWQRSQHCGWQQVTKAFLSVCFDKVPKLLDDEQPGRVARSTGASAVTRPLPRIESLQPPHLLVTVDVEEEFNWNEFSRENHKVRGADALEAYHEDCRAIGLSPVYLVTHPIVQDDAFARFFERVLREGTGEVGIQMHAWTTPPFWEFPNAFNSFQCNLPAHVERRKVEFLCRAFEDRFGQTATIHRAGRWGSGPHTADILADAGIQIDLSPSTGFSNPEAGAPDFSVLDGFPYWAGRDQNVLTLPASTINCLRGPEWVSRAFFSFLGSVPQLQGLGTPVRFSPEGVSSDLLGAIARQLVVRRVPVAVYSLHSTSLYAGGSPYSTDAEMAARMRSAAIDTLRQCVEEGIVVPSTCAEVYSIVKNGCAETEALQQHQGGATAA